MCSDKRKAHVAVVINMAQDVECSEHDLLRFHNKLSEAVRDFMTDYYVSMSLEKNDGMITAYLREEEIAKFS